MGPLKNEIAALKRLGIMHRPCPVMGKVEVMKRETRDGQCWDRWVEIPFTVEAIEAWATCGS